MTQDINIDTQASLPSSPEQALQVLCQISQRLVDIAEQESQALVQNDMLALAILQDEKENISQRYLAASTEFRARMREFRRVSPALIKRLEDLQKTLGLRTKDNNALIAQIKMRAEHNTTQSLLLAQEYGKRPTARFVRPDVANTNAREIAKEGAQS